MTLAQARSFLFRCATVPSEVVGIFATVQVPVRRRSISIRIRGRTFADVLLPDGTNVNHTLVKEGWWWYRKYAPGNTVLEGLEAEAREARKGLGADPQPVPPWEWRKSNTSNLSR
jgi:endonuclease YncB( thermonuclease family)